MRPQFARAVMFVALFVCLGGARSWALPEDRDTHIASNTVALRELLEGNQGRRETWAAAPSLVIISTVMDYASGDLLTGFTATNDRLSEQDRNALASDLTRAVGELTGGAIKAFADIRVESAAPGQIVKMLRSGQIVAGRFHGVRATTGSLGYGGRMARQGRISAAAVIVDNDADRDPRQQAVLRTHELGHALGYNHVDALPSIMNPRAGRGLTDFDRLAVKVAYLRPVVN